MSPALPSELYAMRVRCAHLGCALPEAASAGTLGLSLCIAASTLVGSRSTNKVLCCPERAEVRQFLRQWAGQRAPHTLEKVKAHDSAGVRSGSIKALGNDKVDGLAKEAARGVPLTYKSDCASLTSSSFRTPRGP